MTLALASAGFALAKAPRAAAEKAAKVPNYTDEQTKLVVSEYLGGATVEAIAEMVGKTTRSIVAKLSRERDADGNSIYKAKEYKTKTGEKVQKKDETADAIGAVLKLSESETESLTKANKTALKKIWTALANSKPLDGDDSDMVNMSAND